MPKWKCSHILASLCSNRLAKSFSGNYLIILGPLAILFVPIIVIGVNPVDTEEKRQRNHVKTKLKPANECDTESLQEFTQMMIDAFKRV